MPFPFVILLSLNWLAMLRPELITERSDVR